MIEQSKMSVKVCTNKTRSCRSCYCFMCLFVEDIDCYNTANNHDDSNDTDNNDTERHNVCHLLIAHKLTHTQMFTWSQSSMRLTYNTVQKCGVKGQLSFLL